MMEDGVYVNRKKIDYNRWIWYRESSSQRGELYVHLMSKTDEDIADPVDLRICIDGGGVRLTDCVLSQRFRCADVWVQVYKGVATEVGRAAVFDLSEEYRMDSKATCDTSDSGLIVPVHKPEPATKPEAAEVRDSFPIKAGWNYSKCGERYYRSTEEAFRMRALEDLYIAVDRGGGGIKLGKDAESRSRCERLLNELAVELVGGTPEGYEEFT